MARERAKPRFDVVNEQVILASVLCDEQARKRALGCLRPGDWLGRRHRVVFRALTACESKGVRPTLSNLAAEAGGEEFGGLSYLRKLQSMGTVDGIDLYLDTLRKDAARVRAGRLVEDLETTLEDRSVDWGDCVSSVVEVLDELKAAPVARAGTGEEARRWLEDFKARRAGEIAGLFVPTGYDALDPVLGEGLAPGSVTVLAGRPRMGKTSFVVDQVARLLKKTDKRILVCSIEKGRDYFLGLLAARLSGIDKELINKRPQDMTEKQARKVERVIRRAFKDGRLQVVGNPVKDLLAGGEWDNRRAVGRMAEMLSGGRYDVAYWDVWQYALCDTRSAGVNQALVQFYEANRAAATHSVIVHHVARRAEDRRYDKSRRPSLIDLRDSGAYEQRLDLVMFVHREKVFKPYMRGDVMEVIVAKQKSGVDGVTVLADFEPATCRLRRDRLAGTDHKQGKAAARDTRRWSDEV